MFGRNKKKSDLDWQPDTEPDAPEASLSSSANHKEKHKEKPRAAALATKRASNPTIPASDVWSGLIHPRSILRFVRQQFVLITVVAIVVFAAGMTVYSLLPTKFASKALILVDPRQPRVTDSDTVLSGIGGDAAALTSYVQIMKSDGFLAKIVDELGVKGDPDYAKAQNETALTSMFAKNIESNRQGATYIVEVNATSSSRENAAKYANGVAEAFVRDQKDYRANANEEAAQWLSSRLKLLHSNLKKSEEAVANFRARNGIVDTGAQGTLDDQQLSSLVGQISTVTTELADAKARYDQARKDGVPGSTSPSQSGAFSNLDQLLQEQNRLRREAAELNQTLGSRHPRVLANREQQSIIAGQVAKERSRLVERAKQDYETTAAKKQALEGQLADLRQRSILVNKAKVELDNLEREATANRNLYEQFLARYKITDEQAQFNFSEARIVSKATVPNKSTKPSSKLVGVALLILGFGLGLMVALIKVAFAAPESRREDYDIYPNDEPGGFGRAVPLANSAGFAGNFAYGLSGYQGGQSYAKPGFDAPSPSVVKSSTSPTETVSKVEAATGAELASVVSQEEEKRPVSQGLQSEAPEPASEGLASIPEASKKIVGLASAVRHKGTASEPEKMKSEQQELKEDQAPVVSINMDQSEQDAGRDVVASPDPVIIRLPNTLSDEEGASDGGNHLAQYADALDEFVFGEAEEESVSLLITAAQPGDGLQIASDMVIDFAVEAGFHPVVISLTDQPARTQQMGNGAKTPRSVAKVEQFPAYDLIPFEGASGLSRAQGLDLALAKELSELIDLCRETYGFVIIKPMQILNPNTLEDLLDLLDRCLLVLDSRELEKGDLADWRDWANECGAGLVLSHT
nr:GumC family protein [uncultured Cohaesibacter sp.]